jgi:peptidoglycan/xylan/chitin deacetylase (PgdA/CDA1 family)
MFVRLVKVFFGVLVAGADWLNVAASRALNIQRGPRLVIIYYHAIRPKLKERFEWQMAELARLTTPLDLGSTTALSPGKRYSAVTFDDGFISVVDNALPVLEKLGITCTIFVPSGSLGSRPKWIKPSHDDGQEIVASAELVRELAARPLVRIGSHSVSHPDFRRLDDARANEEFTASKQALERVSGREVRTFSFPHGAHTQRDLELARRCGYSRVYTIEPRQLTGLDAFTMGRVRVEPCDWAIEFRLKVLGAYRWMVHASALKRWLRDLFKGSVSDLPVGA